MYRFAFVVAFVVVAVVVVLLFISLSFPNDQTSVQREP